MIQINKKTFELNPSDSEFMDKQLIEHTCKTNISPQLMFRQSYTGETRKSFVGNWDKNGFWISKFRRQFLGLRPDIIARFIFKGDKRDKLIVKFSIGFSSIVNAFFGGILFMILIGRLLGGYLLESWIGWLVIYIIISRYALGKMKKAISDNIMKLEL